MRHFDFLLGAHLEMRKWKSAGKKTANQNEEIKQYKLKNKKQNQHATQL